jgi:membrane-bound ClpP family serine protease
MFFNKSSNHIDSIPITVEYILIIIFCLLFFFEEINEPNVNFIYSTYSFWIIIGILIYSTGTFFLFMQSENLSDEEWDRWRIINFVFTLVKNIFFSIAILMKKEESQNSLEKPYEDVIEKPLESL